MVVFGSIDQCILYWLCCWERCWMLQDMDHMVASCVFFVKVGTLDQLEQSKICILTVTTLRIVMLSIQHECIISLCDIEDPRNFSRQASPEVLSVEQFAVCILLTWDFSSCSPLFIPVTKYTTLDWITANRRAVGNPCNLQLYTVQIRLGRACN